MEPVVGYSRAVVSGRNVHVAGTAPIPKDGDPPDGAYDQMRLCLEIVREALERAGAGFEDVVRTRMFIVNADDWPEIARAHGEVFADIRPASTAIVIKGLLDTRWRVEIEAEAVLPS
jgi:enamine deaminase RidA (YjgF/YER057c/UK114 family)